MRVVDATVILSAWARVKEPALAASLCYIRPKHPYKESEGEECLTLRINDLLHETVTNSWNASMSQWKALNGPDTTPVSVHHLNDMPRTHRKESSFSGEVDSEAPSCSQGYRGGIPSEGFSGDSCGLGRLGMVSFNVT